MRLIGNFRLLLERFVVSQAVYNKYDQTDERSKHEEDPETNQQPERRVVRAYVLGLFNLNYLLRCWCWSNIAGCEHR